MMSETVHYKGKMTLLPKLSGETLENQCKRIVCDNNKLDINEVENPSYYDTWEEYLLDMYYKKYATAKGNLYKIDSIKEVEEYDMFNVNKVSESQFEYEVMYYNGGMGLSDAIARALDESKNQIWS